LLRVEVQIAKIKRALIVGRVLKRVGIASARTAKLSRVETAAATEVVEAAEAAGVEGAAEAVGVEGSIGEKGQEEV
jgi:hypothetical protein